MAEDTDLGIRLAQAYRGCFDERIAMQFVKLFR